MSFHPNWRTPSFFRGVAKNHQPATKWCFFWCGVFWYSHFGKVSFILVYMFCWLYFAIIRHWRAFPWSCDSRADPWWNPAYWPSVGTKDLKRTRPSIGRHFNWWFIQFSVIPWFWNDMLIYFEISWYMLIIILGNTGEIWWGLQRSHFIHLHPFQPFLVPRLAMDSRIKATSAIHKAAHTMEADFTIDNDKLQASIASIRHTPVGAVNLSGNLLYL